MSVFDFLLFIIYLIFSRRKIVKYVWIAVKKNISDYLLGSSLRCFSRYIFISTKTDSNFSTYSPKFFLSSNVSKDSVPKRDVQNINHNKHTVQSNQSFNTPQPPHPTTKMAFTSIPTLNCLAINIYSKVWHGRTWSKREAKTGPAAARATLL